VPLFSRAKISTFPVFMTPTYTSLQQSLVVDSKNTDEVLCHNYDKPHGSKFTTQLTKKQV
jgi:hypothetical protein